MKKSEELVKRYGNTVVIRRRNIVKKAIEIDKQKSDENLVKMLRSLVKEGDKK